VLLSTTTTIIDSRLEREEASEETEEIEVVGEE